MHKEELISTYLGDVLPEVATTDIDIAHTYIEQTITERLPKLLGIIVNLQVAGIAHHELEHFGKPTTTHALLRMMEQGWKIVIAPAKYKRPARFLFSRCAPSVLSKNKKTSKL